MASNNQFLKLPDEVITEIFASAGPMDTARCSMVCTKFHSISKNSRQLWRKFVLQDFQLGQEKDCDWKAVYPYLLKRQGKFDISAPPLPARVVFADDGSHTPGFPPENATSPHWTRPYSTGQGVVKDVDLVIDLNEVCLITGFAAANHCSSCSGPLKEALVFASLNPPSLDDARQYDGKVGSEWVNKLESHLERQEENEEIYPLDFDKKVNKLGFVMFTPCNATEPLAGFQFPNVPDCYRERLIRYCYKPMVGRYVHFKLLSIFDPFSRRMTNNIDVMDLHTFGVALSELPSLLQNDMLNGEHPYPSYQRIHQVHQQEFPFRLNDGTDDDEEVFWLNDETDDDEEIFRVNDESEEEGI